MRIKTKFILTMFLFGIILVIMAMSAIITSRLVEKAGEQEWIAGNIAQGANDLSYLANDYLIYRETQQLKRWQSRFTSFSSQIARLNADRPEEQVLVRNIQANQKRLKEVFESTVAAAGNSSSNQRVTRDPAFLQVSWSRLAVQSQALISDASRLSRLLHQQRERLMETRTILMYVMVTLFGVFLIASYRLIYRRILKSMAMLQAGTAVIGSGNLDFIIEERKEDEIGDLAQAFNRMTKNLKNVTASKADLEREISEREKAQVALRESEQRWATTLASIGDAVIATDVASRITFMNGTAEGLTGWQSNEALSKPVVEVFNIINEQSRQKVENPVEKVLEKGNIVGLANHTVLLRKDGTELPIGDSGAPIRDPNGKITGVVLVFRNITERRKAEQALRESEAKANALIKYAPTGIYEVDYRTADFINVNDAMCQILGYTREELFAMGPAALLDDKGRALFTNRIRRQLAGEKVEEAVEYRVRKKGGNFIDAILNVSFIAGNEPGRALVVAHDITERKRAEEELRRSRDELEIKVQERTADLANANKELQEEMVKREKAEQQLLQAQKLESIGTLTGGIAHDFNNILGAIVINSEMALLDLPAGSGVRGNLELILKSGERGRDLVRQMLLFSRKSEKKQEILALIPFIKETFRLLRSSIPATIQMKLHLETESDVVFADPSQVQQVIMNLCTNAAYAMRGTTGSIDISLQAVTFGSTDLPEADMQPGDYLVLSVKDTGSGMDEEVRKRVFEPFFTTKPVGEGTGLGLSVAYGIVKSHRGNISVYSEPGRGSIFRVYLPKAVAGVTEKAEPPKPIPGGNERILFVDDEEIIVQSVRNMLIRLGYQVATVTDSEDALKLFSEKPSEFDLVMTDQTMPAMTGEDLGRELMRIRPDIPVILCTGYSDLISSKKAMTMGFRGFIMKPFTLRESAELVRRVLDEKKK